MSLLARRPQAGYLERMIRYRDGQKLPRLAVDLKHGSIVTIGHFDGLHVGHRDILAVALQLAKDQQMPLLAIIFDPHPSVVLGAAKNLQLGGHLLLTEPEERAELMRTLGVDEVICCDFTRELSMLTAETFCQEILSGWLHMRCLCVGEGFRLGYQRQGDEREMQRLGEKYGFTNLYVPTKAALGERVSSSRIRHLLTTGRVTEANELLGMPYNIKGIVVPGDARGRELGFHTANLQTSAHRLLPLKGVYATYFDVNSKRYQSVTNIGERPTFHTEGVIHVESHLLDFSGDLYGTTATLSFVERLRDERRFADAAALKQQIADDVLQAKAIFGGKLESP